MEHTFLAGLDAPSDDDVLDAEGRAGDGAEEQVHDASEDLVRHRLVGQLVGVEGLQERERRARAKEHAPVVLEGDVSGHDRDR